MSTLTYDGSELVYDGSTLTYGTLVEPGLVDLSLSPVSPVFAHLDAAAPLTGPQTPVGPLVLTLGAVGPQLSRPETADPAVVRPGADPAVVRPGASPQVVRPGAEPKIR